MKNIFRIYINDLKTVSRNIIVFVVTIGISLLPALYSWFNIASNWDPYSSTGGLSFAVCSKDKGYSYKILTINAGNEIVNNLKQNDKMGWDFVTEQEALDGVENGTYYAAVIIPEDFSDCLFSVTTGEFKQAKLQYYVNEKKNPIAPKMTNAGVQTVENTIKSTYVGTATKIIATTLNLTTDDLGKTKESASEQIIEYLDNAIKDVDSFHSTIDVFTSTLDTVDGIIKTNKDMLPDIQDKILKASDIPKDIKGTIAAARTTSSQLTDALSDLMDSTKTYSTNISDIIYEAFDGLETESFDAGSKLKEATYISEKIIAINNRIITVFENIQEYLEIDCSEVISRLSAANTRQQSLIDSINSASDILANKGSLPKEIQEEVLSLADSASTDLESIKTVFSGIKGQLDTSVDNIYNSLDKASEVIETLGGDIPELENTFDNASDNIASMKTTFENLGKLIDDTKDKLSSLKDTVEQLKSDNTVENLITPIINDPNALGNFVSSPVVTETTEIHAVENYGSAMAPFYTSLGIWVGGIILVAVTRVELTKKQLSRLERPTSTQLYFGRYLFFMTFALIQSLIIALGDIYFMKIQCNSIGLFIAASLVSGFVYSLIIYSLTITFNVIGKALAVIILIVQVAGSGGTFPIEVLPKPFQSLVPYLPFRYGNDAFREAIAGPDISAFWHNILMLLAFVPFALILGILLRKPCIKFMGFFDRKIHESELII